jgi:hypothetical protein
VSSFTWIDEMATYPGAVPQLGKWHGGKDIVAISTPKGGKLLMPGRPVPRWRTELRRATSLATPVGKGEVAFHCIQLDPLTVHKDDFQLYIDGYRWQGRWVMLDVRMEHQMQHFQSFHDPFPKAIKTGPSTMTISLQNLSSPGQKVTFELQGAWDLQQDVGTGRYTIKRQKPVTQLAAKTEKKEYIPWE